jgi:hypothetical protein
MLAIAPVLLKLCCGPSSTKLFFYLFFQKVISNSPNKKAEFQRNSAFNNEPKILFEDHLNKRR